MRFDFLLEKRVRRAILKQKGNEISIPIPRPNQALKNEIKVKIASGQYNLGVPVLETSFTKLVLTPNGTIEKKNSTLTARKYPLSDVRRESLAKKSKYMKIRKDEHYETMSEAEAVQSIEKIESAYTVGASANKAVEALKSMQRQRNWLIWHDHSGIGNRGLMLFLLRELYDPAIHMTRDEYKNKTGLEVNIQSVIEEPQLYIMGHSGCTDADQMMFIPTRRQCLYSLSQPIEKDGIPIKDRMRFMNGDNPSIEFEDGTQKGGHRGCAGCEGDMRRAGEYDHMAYLHYKSLDEKQKLVLAGHFGKNSSLHPFQNLKVEQLRKELRTRSLDDSGLKPELSERLTEALGGTTRVPALLFDTDATLSDLNLDSYEVLFFEPLHCCLNHIAHIMQELPLKLTDVNILTALNEITSITLNKEKLRCTDYRRALLQITLQLAKLLNVPSDVMELLLTFSEMMGIFYADDEKRTAKQVLRLYNLSFRHALAVQSVLIPPKSMTRRKMQGIYYHQIINHSAFIYRIICLKSINAELFERYFERIEDITRKTWSKHPEDLVSNAFLHVQAEDEMGQERSAMQVQEKEISKLAKQLPTATNTVIKQHILQKNSRLWQSHLQRIPDYLIPGVGYWWKWTVDGSVEFHDGPDQDESRPCGPHLYHFRSTSISEIQQQLGEKWKECKSIPQSLPLHKLRDEEGKLIFQREAGN